MESKVKRPFSFFSDFIPYYRQLRPITGSVLTSILVTRLEYWFEKKKGGFYKFFEPCPGNENYEPGDSWTEELAFSRAEFNAAFEYVGISYASKKEYDSAESKFKRIIETPKYEFIKNFGKKNNLTTKKVIGKEKQEIEVYYCRYHDRMKNYTYYFKNPNKSILQDAENLVNRDSRITVSRERRITVSRERRITVSRKSRDTYSDSLEPRKPIASNYTSLYTKEDHKKTQEKTDQLPLNHSSQKQPLAKYRDEWDQWKAERGEKMLTDTLGEKPIFTEKDMAAFCKLRGYGKTLSEITYRFMVYCRTPNKWYAEKGYAFHVFAENYSSFGAKMQQIKSAAGNGKQEKKITTAPESAYFSSTKQPARSDEDMARENKKMLETIQALKKQEGITSDARAAA